MLIKLFEDNPNERDILKIVSLLRKGGIIIYPTDTVYAIGCDINNVKAVQRIAALKGIKPEKASFSMICRDLSNIATYAKVSDEVFKIMKRCLPGPFTFILNATTKLPNVLMNRRKTIGIRIPANYIAMAIVEELGNPLLTTSVHDDDEIVEYTTDPELIHEKYCRSVDLVIDGGYGHNVASTVVDCTGDEPEIIRQGIGEL
ncbi:MULTISPECIES: L-threonylcarbamoyladenylate synthase [Culturomica]|jgi:tRNA threonylcarbamoyl adenosine modification protein (Sua5/YciO/YrdC/YwlC family)|uniref:L-threonylcarbamoyladenylate synthase n=1 Tax=Culturomica TaxID=1926651 RepID=UPI000339F655|nr:MULTISPECIES: L-threonylcarbamoyladenylate synthase [Culturomica]CCZ09821.1 sua5/YciO/YrdC/YwlC family protein [Odoribacter sp. CAG:788]HBO26602.1 threonylcarbamoyl-AMP synthase [Culturomica sp.]